MGNVLSRVGYVTRQITSRSLRTQRLFIELIHQHLLRVRNTATITCSITITASTSMLILPPAAVTSQLSLVVAGSQLSSAAAIPRLSRWNALPCYISGAVAMHWTFCCPSPGKRCFADSVIALPWRYLLQTRYSIFWAPIGKYNKSWNRLVTKILSFAIFCLPLFLFDEHEARSKLLHSQISAY
jgi:hypothetical protein